MNFKFVTPEDAVWILERDKLLDNACKHSSKKYYGCTYEDIMVITTNTVFCNYHYKCQDCGLAWKEVHILGEVLAQKTR